MGIVAALIEARKEMEPLVADEKASMGKYTFRYASLPNILKVVIPSLGKHGVLLLQDVSSDDKLINVVTKLMSDQDTIVSKEMRIEYDGTTSDLTKKSTTARRVQILSMLGLAAEDDDEPQQRPTYPPRNTQAAPPPPPPQRPADAVWADQAHLRKAAMMGASSIRNADKDVQVLAERLRSTDNGDNMPTNPREGAAISMYDYLLELIGQVSDPQLTLSYLLGRVVWHETPPKATHRWLIDELREGKHKETLRSVEKLAAK